MKKEEKGSTLKIGSYEITPIERTEIRAYFKKGKGFVWASKSPVKIVIKHKNGHEVTVSLPLSASSR